MRSGNRGAQAGNLNRDEVAVELIYDVQRDVRKKGCLSFGIGMLR